MKKVSLPRALFYVGMLICVALGPTFSSAFAAQAAPLPARPWLAARSQGLGKQAGSFPKNLASILNADGTLRVDSTTQGSFSAAGWQMVAGANNQLRFVQSSPAGKPDSSGIKSPQLAGDANWSPGLVDGVSSGPSSASIRAIAVSGTDVYIGGFFSQAGGIPANNIARWSTTTHQWDAMHAGISGQIYAIVPHGNYIYVGGSFNDINGTSAYSLARWDTVAQTWSLVGGAPGLTSGNGQFVGIAYALAFDASGSLYVGGVFDHVGGKAAANIARWDGATWTALGSGLGGANDSVNALVISGSDLFAGGSFTNPYSNIARWDGANWNGMGGTNGRVLALYLDGSSLYAGGLFTQAGITSVQNLAVWTGGSTWQDVGGGADNEVTAIVPGPGGFIVTGGFQNVGGSSAHHAALWSGSAWSTLTYGVSGEAYAAAAMGGLVFIGGDFHDMRYDSSNHIAIWNSADSTWYGLGNSVDGPVFAVAISGSDVYVGGQFNTAGGIPAANVARWNSRTGLWSAHDLGVTGCNGTLCTPTVYALVVNGTRVFAGGNFSSVGNNLKLAARNLAIWDDSLPYWIPGDAEGCPMVDPNCETAVYALSPDGTGVDFGGYFTDACSFTCMTVNNVGYWDGSIYHQFTDGATVGIGSGNVSALLNDGAGVYIGGQFTSPRTNLVYFDGSSFYGVGSPLGTFITALAEDNQYLYAGGLFTNAGGNAGANNIARLSLSSPGDWQPVGAGFDDVVLSLALNGPDLIAGGRFTKNGTTGLNKIARWNTTTQTWSALGSGADSLVNSIAANPNEIFVGGHFIQMGAKEADYFALWASFSFYLPQVRR